MGLFNTFNDCRILPSVYDGWYGKVVGKVVHVINWLLLLNPYLRTYVHIENKYKGKPQTSSGK